MARNAAVRIGRRTRLALAIATGIGLVAFVWPFVLAPGPKSSVFLPPLLFGALLVLVLAVVFADLASGGIDAKAIAMLGILAAVGAAIRPLGAGTAGVETVFFILVIAGRVYGPGFGFALGCVALFASALLTQHAYEVKVASLVRDAKILLMIEKPNFILAGPSTRPDALDQTLSTFRTLAPAAKVLAVNPALKTQDPHHAGEALLQMLAPSSQ